MTQISIQVVFSAAPRVWREDALRINAGDCVNHIKTIYAEYLSRTERELLHACDAGIFGEKIKDDRVLRDGDRLEFYRALRVDPKVARRERFAKQGSRKSGLFNHRS